MSLFKLPTFKKASTAFKTMVDKSVDKQNFYQRGQTLIETLAGLFILVTGISAAVSLAIFAFGSSTAILKQITATGLAREGLEAVRNMRDTNWLKDTKVVKGCYDYTTGAPSAADCYQNWLGEKTSPAVPFCLNPSLGSSGAQALPGQMIFTGGNIYTVYFNGVSQWFSGLYAGRPFNNPGAITKSITFAAGPNVIAAQARTDGGHAGYDIFLADVTIGSTHTGSSNSWKIKRQLNGDGSPDIGPFYYPQAPPDDAQGLHWYDVGYDDSSWANATDLGPFLGSPIQTYPYGNPSGTPNMPTSTPGHLIWDASVFPISYGYTVYIRGDFNNGSCGSEILNAPTYYNIKLNSSNPNSWILTQTDTNTALFGLQYNDPAASAAWQQNGFYSPSGSGTACNGSAGSSDFCRSIVLTKYKDPPIYDKDPNFSLLKVQSQVWWVDKRCPRAPTFDLAPVACRVELDAYLTNWK